MNVAILGGGMGALAAAWDLSKQGANVTIYQRGWRLGGKGASGADVIGKDWRIEEHGLHILLGFYTNAFEILREAYDEARAHWPHAELPAFDDVLIVQKKIWVGEPRGKDKWEFWENSLDMLDPRSEAAGLSALQHGLNQLPKLIDHFRTRIAVMTGSPVPPPITAMAAEESLGTRIQRLAEAHFLDQMEVAAQLTRLFEESLLQAEPYLEDGARLQAMGLRSYGLRQAIAVLYLLATIPARMIRDGIMKPSPDFSKIDGQDFRTWLRGNDKEKWRAVTWDSPYVRALYDLCFSLGRTLAAGVGCNHLKNILFGWKKAVLFKMDGGMGDVVFAPIYLALANRKNVAFRFFHRAVGLELDASQRFVDKVTLEKQVEGLSTYDPLEKNATDDLPSWPNEPLLDRMTQGYRVARQTAGKMPHDFETEFPWNFAEKNPVTLVRGKDFDAVVLGMSVGGLTGDLGRPLRVNQNFDRMLNAATTTPTRAFQLWLKSVTDTELNWNEGRAMAGFAEPFSSCTDMNQTLRHEDWAVGKARTLAYVCGAYPNAPENKEAATREVDKEAREWIDKYAHMLMPGAADRNGHFDWNLLVDPKRGFYPRANVDPSDHYVLSEQGRIATRLAPDESGFENVFLAGDWVKNPLSSGCLESATFGGRLAAAGIVRGLAPSKAAYVETDGDWCIRPPGLLTKCDMNIFLVKAKHEKLLDVCVQLVNGRKSGVEVEPLKPSFVMLVFANVGAGYSTDQPELGDQSEIDMSIFIPVTLRVNGKSQGLAALAPYVFVDNVAGLVTGREVIGFPKHAATHMEFDSKKCVFGTKSWVLPTAGPHKSLQDLVVARITGSNLKMQLESAEQQILASPSLSISDLVSLVSRELGGLPAFRFGEVPLVFLKQFRDAANPRLACHQELVLVHSQVSLPRRIRVHRGDYSLSLPEYAKPSIAKTLGISQPPQVHGLWISLDLDFSLPTGVSLWKAT